MNKIINLKCNIPPKRNLRTADKDISWFWLTSVPSASVLFFYGLFHTLKQQRPSCTWRAKTQCAIFICLGSGKIIYSKVYIYCTLPKRKHTIQKEYFSSFIKCEDIRWRINVFLWGKKINVWYQWNLCNFLNRISREKLNIWNYWKNKKLKCFRWGI